MRTFICIDGMHASLCTLLCKRYKFMSIFRSHGHLMCLFLYFLFVFFFLFLFLFVCLELFPYICRICSILFANSLSASSRASSFHFGCVSIPIYFAKRCKSEYKIENVLTPNTLWFVLTTATTTTTIRIDASFILSILIYYLFSLCFDLLLLSRNGELKHTNCLSNFFIFFINWFHLFCNLVDMVFVFFWYKERST